MTGRSRCLPGLLLLAALALAACGEDTVQGVTANPTPSEAPAGPIVLPPPAAAPAATDTSPAGVALAVAAKKTSEAGAFRIQLSAAFGGAGASSSGTMTGIGETESHTRFHVLITFTSGAQHLTTESIGYDGVTYGRSTTKPWHVVAGATPTDPRGYLRYLTGAAGVRDAGPGSHDGRPAERYEATVDLSRPASGPTPAAAAPAPSSEPGRLVAWVDLASGRLTGEDLSSAASSSQSTQLSISFVDFGGAIKVVPPTATP